jgi:cell division protein FtsW
MLTIPAFTRNKLWTDSSSDPLPPLDPWLLWAGLILMGLGLLMVTSASIPQAQEKFGQPFYFLLRQSVFMGIGLLLAAAVLRMPLAFWQVTSALLLMLGFGLLVAVLIPGIGKQVNGSMRWIVIGPLSLQASEPAKLFAIIYLAGYLQRHRVAIQTSTMAVVRPLLMLGALAILLLLEPDFGTAVVLLGTALGMIFLAGVNIWRFLGLQGVILVLMTGLLYSSEYRRARLVSFLDPWADPFNSGFQLTQSLIAVGRGKLFGVGLGASVQKLFYLPEAHTDFLFAILAEELGLMGVLLVIALYAVIVARAFSIAARAEWLEARFAAYLAYGIGLWFSIQALFNMGVTLGVLPTKGLTLPLLSNGGSSVVIMCIALAILLRIDGEMRRADPRLRRRIAQTPASHDDAKTVKQGVVAPSHRLGLGKL